MLLEPEFATYMNRAGGFQTSRITLSVAPCQAAVSVVMPVATGVTTPVLEIVAAEGSEDVQESG